MVAEELLGSRLIQVSKEDLRLSDGRSRRLEGRCTWGQGEYLANDGGAFRTQCDEVDIVKQRLARDRFAHEARRGDLGKDDFFLEVIGLADEDEIGRASCRD